METETKGLARQLRRVEAEQCRMVRIRECMHADFVRSVNRMTRAPLHEQCTAVKVANNELNVWKAAEFDAYITSSQIRLRLFDVAQAQRKTGH
jgi:hypothetical protein